MTSHRWLKWAVGTVVLVASGSVFAQSIHCESRDYRRNYCPTGRITGAQIISQTSNAACIQGRSWGWDSNGIWVNSGCAGDFAFQGGGPRRDPVRRSAPTASSAKAAIISRTSAVPA